MKHPDGGYAVDMSVMEGLEVRPGYKKYGSCVHVADNLQAITKATYMGKTFFPGDPEFMGVCHVMRVSQFLWQSAITHALLIHFAVVSWNTLATRESLPAAHPIRRFMAPFTVLGAQISIFAERIVTDKGGVVSRVTGLAEGSKPPVFLAGAKALNWEVGALDVLDKCEHRVAELLWVVHYRCFLRSWRGRAS